MGTRELREAYGASSGEQAIHRAIRAELPGGDELMRALERAASLVHALPKDHPHYPALSLVLSDLRLAKQAMALEIRARYDVG